MASRHRFEAAAGRIRRLSSDGLDAVALRLEVLREVAAVVPLDGAFLPTADPATLLYTSAVRVDLPDGVTVQFLDNEFRRDDVNKFRWLATAGTRVATLDAATVGERSSSPRWREIMDPMGLGDELRVVFGAGATTWGFACLHRARDRPSFDSDEVAFVGAIAPYVGEGLRRAAMAERAAADASGEGPGVVTLAPDYSVTAATVAGLRWLDELGATERRLTRPVPVAVLAVAQALDDLGDAGRVPRLTVRAASGRWLVLHASRLREQGGGTGEVAVVIEPAGRAELEPMVVAGYQLTAREAETLTLVLRGLSTKAIAAALGVSGHTVHDHVKAIFDKTGVASRGELMATVFRDYQRRPSPPG